MSHIVLKNIDIDKINIKESYNKYNIFYNDLFCIIGIPIQCSGEIIDDRGNYKFYIDAKSLPILMKIQSFLKSQFDRCNDFINYDKIGNYIYFTNNYYTKDKLNGTITDLYLNIKYINKINYNTLIHII